jgi:hypothetical protein
MTPTLQESKFLAIYLNDHLGGATGGLQLARRLFANNKDVDEFAVPLRRICQEIEEDRAALEQVMERLGFPRGKVKPAGAWVAEKLGRLKLNGNLWRYSPLSRLLELESLQMGVTGKLELWRTLTTVPGSERAEIDFERFAGRASVQLATLEDLHRRAAKVLVSP